MLTLREKERKAEVKIINEGANKQWIKHIMDNDIANLSVVSCVLIIIITL